MAERLSQLYGLTPRGAEVVRYLALGYSRPYIAKRLGVSKETAKAHTYHIYQKVGAASQDELIELCHRMAREAV